MKYLVYITLISFLFFSCNNKHVVSTGKLALEIDNNLQAGIKINSQKISQTTIPNYIVINNQEVKDFGVKKFSKRIFKDKIGKGTEYTFVAEHNGAWVKLIKIEKYRIYDSFPDMIVNQVIYINKSDSDLFINKWINNDFILSGENGDTIFWSFNGESTVNRSDWILPVVPGFYKRNFMGMNNEDYGGGIPVSDVWTRKWGIAIGHLQLRPERVEIPIKALPGHKANIHIDFVVNTTLAPGDTLKTFETFILAHAGDCYNSLKEYANFLRKKGLKFLDTNPQSYEPIWCAWGYRRDFTPEQIIKTLPKVKELGFKWVVIDDGYQIEEANWHADTKKFPGGDKDMKKLIDKIHSYGLKAKLWWAPMAAGPCTDFVLNHRDAIITNDEDVPRYITWWDDYYMDPSNAYTLEHTKNVLNLFFGQWNIDGLKIDGQHLNAAPPNYNWRLENYDPMNSYYGVPKFFKFIKDKTFSYKPDAVIEICPCGTCMSIYNMQFVNQTVASDPLSSRQIRIKGKVYKAILRKTAYYGDHVELSDGGNDFASTIGIGGVPGSKFTYPFYNSDDSVCYLSPEKEKLWKKWLDIYYQKMLPKGDYLGYLYDIGFDYPEAHVIRKQDTLFYAFYAPEFSGTIELRGLQADKQYHVYDYFNNTNYGKISGSNPLLKVHFNKFLLLQVY